MVYKIIGIALIIFACGGFSFSIVCAHKNEVNYLRCLLRAISFMKCELEYRHAPMAEVCRNTADICQNKTGEFFKYLSEELDSQIYPDPQFCTNNALSKIKVFPNSVRECILQFSSTLGAFDLDGQIQELNRIEQLIEQSLDKLTFEQGQRLRSYQTLGLCAGAAIAILLI